MKIYSLMKNLSRFATIALLLAFLAPGPVRAASNSWNVNAAGNWATAGSWLGGVNIPGSTTADNSDIATFSFTLTAARAVTVDANRYIGEIDFGNTSNFGYTLGTGILHLNNGGLIQTVAGNGNHTDTISSAIVISGTSATAATFTANATSATSLLSIGAVTGSATSGNTTTLTLNGTNAGSNAVTGIIGDGAGTGKLAVTKSGTGLWTLSGTNTFTGALTVEEGTLSVASLSTNVGAASSVILGKSGTTGTLQYTGSTSGSSVKAFSLATGGTGEFLVSNAAMVLTLTTAITGNGSLTKTGSGTLALNGVNTYSGLTTVTAGTLSLGNTTNTLPNSAVILVNGGTLDVANNDTVGVVTISSGTISGTGTLSGSSYALTDSGTISAALAGTGSTLTKTGAGTVALNATNTFTGAVTVEEGTLNIAGTLTNTLGSASTVTLGKSGGTGTLEYTNTGGTAAARTFVMAAGGTGAFQVDVVTTTLPISGVISGSGGLTKTGAGILNLSGANTYSGDTTVSLGTLVAGNALAFQNSTLQYSAGTVQFATGITAYTLGGLAGSQALSLLNAGSAAVALTLGNNNGNTTYSGALSGALGSVIKTGTGTQVLSGANTYTGTTTVSVGTLQFAKQTSLYNNGTGSWTVTNLIVSSGASAAFNVGGTGEFTSANIDTLKALGTASGGFKNGSILGLDTTGGNFSYTSAIANTNSLANAIGFAKLGSNTLTLSGTNTYSGGTTVSAGTLLVNNASGSGTGTGSLAVSVGAVLGGTGTISGATTVGGGLAPGNGGSNIAKLTFGSTLNLATAENVTFDINGTTRGTNYDAVDVTGALTNGGALVLNFASAFLPTTSTVFDLFALGGGQSGDFASVSITGLYSALLVKDNFGVWTGTDNAAGRSFTYSQSTGNLTAVPEPSTWALWTISLTTVMIFRRRRR